MQEHDDLTPDELMPRPAPAPEEIARVATSSAGGWTARQLAEWGIAFPPPRGWRDALRRMYAAGLDVTPIPYLPSPRQERRDARRDGKASIPMQRPTKCTGINPSTGLPWNPIVVSFTREIGTPDPDNPPPWV